MINKLDDFVPIKVIEISKCSQALYLNFDYFELIHELSKALSEDELLSIADDFARSYASDKPEIVGVLLVGSSTIGVCDGLADLDLMVFTDERSLKRRRLRVRVTTKSIG